MIGNTDADGSTLFMLKPTRRLAGRFKEERIRSRRARLQQAKLPSVHLGEAGDLRQVAANQREMMVAIRLTNSANALQGLFISDVTAERVAGVCWVGDDAPMTNDLCSLPHQTLLRILGMKPKALHRLMITTLGTEAL